MVLRERGVNRTCRTNIKMMILFWLVNLTCSGPNCPDDLLSEVFSCLRNLTHGDKRNTFISMSDVEIMHRNCRNGAFRDSVQCLERLHNRCEQPQAKEWLEKLARPKRWEAGFERLCKHVHLYVEQRHCIQKQNIEIESCVKSKSFGLTSTKRFTSNTPDGYGVDIEVMKSICRVFYWTDQCLSESFGLACGEPVSAILRDFQGGITPPVCIDYEAYINSTPFHKTRVSFVTLCTLFSVAILFIL